MDQTVSLVSPSKPNSNNGISGSKVVSRNLEKSPQKKQAMFHSNTSYLSYINVIVPCFSVQKPNIKIMLLGLGEQYLSELNLLKN